MGQRGDLRGALAGEREGQPGLRGDLRVVAAWAICKGDAGAFLLDLSAIVRYNIP